MDQSLYTVGDAREPPFGITRATVASTVDPFFPGDLRAMRETFSDADVDADADEQNG